MKYLRSSIALRILDCLGIFSKDMPNIKLKNYLFKVEDVNIFGIKEVLGVETKIEEDSILAILYAEKEEKKYMVATIKNKDIKPIWFCVFIGDDTENNFELNDIYIIELIDKEFSIRKPATIEIANIFTTFECIRTFFTGWNSFDNKNKNIHLKVLEKLILSINIDES